MERHSVVVGKKNRGWQAVDEVLLLFNHREKKAIKGYQEFIRDGMNMGQRDDLIGGGLIRSAGGWEGVQALRKSKERWRGDERILGEGRFVEEVLNKTDERLQKQERMKAEGWDIDRVIKDVCVHFGIEQEELLSRRRTDRLSLARGVIAKICFDQLGISAQEVGKSLGVSRQAMFKGMEKGERYCRENHDKLTS